MYLVIVTQISYLLFICILYQLPCSYIVIHVSKSFNYCDICETGSPHTTHTILLHIKGDELYRLSLLNDSLLGREYGHLIVAIVHLRLC